MAFYTLSNLDIGFGTFRNVGEQIRMGLVNDM
jgi:hypothetical protein